MAQQDVVRKSDVSLFGSMPGLARASRRATDFTAEPPVERWPGAVRVGVAVGLALVSWVLFTISVAFVEGVLRFVTHGA